MKQILLTTVLSLSFATATVAQEKLWTLDECMRYAVENSPSVKKQVYTSDTYKAERNAAVASFFPAASAKVGAQYSFGRSIDPATNTYENTSTFNNNYGLDASIPIFTGGQLINQWLMANPIAVWELMTSRKRKMISDENHAGLYGCGIL